MGKEARQSYCFDRFRVDPSQGLLLKDGEPLPLPPKVFDTLLVLVENSGRLIGKDELIATLWPDSFVEEGTLARYISDLRKALGESAGDPRFIETVPKRGYRFLANITRSQGELVIERHTRSRILIEQESASANPLKSIAVLPFKPLGPGDGNEYLGLGVADALITRLSSIRQIIVRPTSAVVKYLRRAEEDVFRIGRELEVDSLVEGALQRCDGKIRVTVQLVGMQERSTLWAEKFDGVPADIFAVEDWISERVTQALKLELNQREHKELIRHRTENTEAYESYLRGCYFWNKRGTDHLKKGVEYLKQATDLDPNYASAYAMLADCYTILGCQESLPRAEAFPEAKMAATRALELDYELAEAHGSLAHLMLHDWEWRGAEAEFKRARDLNPGIVSTHLWYAEYLTAVGRTGEAIAEMKLAQQIDPVSVTVSSSMGRALHFARRYDQAIEQYKRTLEMDPHFGPARFRLGLSYAQMGMGEQAIAELGEASILDPNPESWSALGYVLARFGKAREAGEILDRLQATPGSSYQAAVVSAALGRNARAIELLGKAYEERSGALVNLKVEPMLDSLRSEGRFDEVLKQVGLVG